MECGSYTILQYEAGLINFLVDRVTLMSYSMSSIIKTIAKYYKQYLHIMYNNTTFIKQKHS